MQGHDVLRAIVCGRRGSVAGKMFSETSDITDDPPAQPQRRLPNLHHHHADKKGVDKDRFYRIIETYRRKNGCARPRYRRWQQLADERFTLKGMVTQRRNQQRCHDQVKAVLRRQHHITV